MSCAHLRTPLASNSGTNAITSSSATKNGLLAPSRSDHSFRTTPQSGSGSSPEASPVGGQPLSNDGGHLGPVGFDGLTMQSSDADESSCDVRV